MTEAFAAGPSRGPDEKRPAVGRTIADLATFVTSKNGGPFLLTLDIIFSDDATYRRFKDTRRPLRSRVDRFRVLC